MAGTSQVTFELTAENAQLVRKVVESLSAFDDMATKGEGAGRRVAVGGTAARQAFEGLGDSIVGMGTSLLSVEQIAGRVMEGIREEARKTAQAFEEANKRAGESLKFGGTAGPGGLAMGTLAREGLEGMSSGTTTRAQRVALGSALIGADEDLRGNLPKMLGLAQQADRASLGETAITGESGQQFARTMAQLAKVFEDLPAEDIADLAVRLHEEGIGNLDEAIRGLQQLKQVPGMDMGQGLDLTVGALKQDQSGKLLASLTDKLLAEMTREVDVAASIRGGTTVYRGDGPEAVLAELGPQERLKAILANPGLMGNQAGELQAALAGMPRGIIDDARRRDVLGERVLTWSKDPAIARLRREAGRAAEMDRLREDQDPRRLEDEEAARFAEMDARRRHGDTFAGDTVAAFQRAAVWFAGVGERNKTDGAPPMTILGLIGTIGQIAEDIHAMATRSGAVTRPGGQAMNVNAHTGGGA